MSFASSGHAHADLRTAAEAQAIHDAGLSFCRLHLMLTRLAIRQEDSSSTMRVCSYRSSSPRSLLALVRGRRYQVFSATMLLLVGEKKSLLIRLQDCSKTCALGRTLFQELERYRGPPRPDGNGYTCKFVLKFFCQNKGTRGRDTNGRLCP